MQAGGHRFDSDILHFTLRSFSEGEDRTGRRPWSRRAVGKRDKRFKEKDIQTRKVQSKLKERLIIVSVLWTID